VRLPEGKDTAAVLPSPWSCEEESMSPEARRAAVRATRTDRVRSVMAARPGFRDWSARLQSQADRLQRDIARLRRKYSDR